MKSQQIDLFRQKKSLHLQVDLFLVNMISFLLCLAGNLSAYIAAFFNDLYSTYTPRNLFGFLLNQT